MPLINVKSRIKYHKYGIWGNMHELANFCIIFHLLYITIKRAWYIQDRSDRI